jgi:hypothetical protein
MILLAPEWSKAHAVQWSLPWKSSTTIRRYWDVNLEAESFSTKEIVFGVAPHRSISLECTQHFIIHSTFGTRRLGAFEFDMPSLCPGRF